MKAVIYIFYILFLCLVYSCKPVSVSTSSDYQAPLGEYENFSWLPGIQQEVEKSDGYVNLEVFNMIRREVAKEMILKGYRLSDDNPEILVNIEVITEKEEKPVKARTNGYAYWDGFSDEAEYGSGSVVIELLSPESKKVIWQGIAKDFLHEKPNRNTRRIEEAIKLVFKNYQNKIFI